MTEQKLKGRVTGIYGIAYKNKIYIGSAIHIRNRWNGHKSDLKAGIHACQAMQRIFDKFNKGWIERNEEHSFDCFDFFVIKSLDQNFVTHHYNRLKEEYGSRKVGKVFSNLVLVPIEQIYMNMNPKNRLNSLPAAGSNKGNKPSLKTRQKISKAGKGRKHSLSTRQKQSEARLGYIMPEHSRKKLSDAKKGKKRDPQSVKRTAAKLSKPYSFYHEELGLIEGYGIKPLVREMKNRGIKASSTGLRAILNGSAIKNHGFYKDEQSYLDEIKRRSSQSSQETGVYYHKSIKRWIGRDFSKPEPYIGCYKTEQEAIDAVRESKLSNSESV